MHACVAEQQRHLPSKSGVQRLRRCESYRMHQTLIQGCRLTGKPSVSKIEILGSNPSVPAKFRKEPRGKGQVQIRNPQFAIRNSSWKGSLTGKAVVLKTTAHLSLAGSTPVPSANTLPISDCQLPIGLTLKRAKSPDSALETRKQRTENKAPSTNRQLAIGNRKCSEASPNGMAAVC